MKHDAVKMFTKKCYNNYSRFTAELLIQSSLTGKWKNYQNFWTLNLNIHLTI